VIERPKTPVSLEISVPKEEPDKVDLAQTIGDISRAAPPQQNNQNHIRNAVSIDIIVMPDRLPSRHIKLPI
jgi:hypothetical protein